MLFMQDTIKATKNPTHC